MRVCTVFEIELTIFGHLCTIYYDIDQNLYKRFPNYQP
jgi:hypothetical protein